MKQELLQKQELLLRIRAKRGELAKIWLENLEYRETLRLLDQMYFYYFIKFSYQS